MIFVSLTIGALLDDMVEEDPSQSQARHRSISLVAASCSNSDAIASAQQDRGPITVQQDDSEATAKLSREFRSSRSSGSTKWWLSGTKESR